MLVSAIAMTWKECSVVGRGSMSCPATDQTERDGEVVPSWALEQEEPREQAKSYDKSGQADQRGLNSEKLRPPVCRML